MKDPLCSDLDFCTVLEVGREMHRKGPSVRFVGSDMRLEYFQSNKKGSLTHSIEFD